MGAASGAAFLFLGLLWVVGFTRIIAGVLAGIVVLVALLEFAAAVQALDARRVLAAGRTAARAAPVAGGASLPRFRSALAAAFAVSIATGRRLHCASARGGHGAGRLAAVAQGGAAAKRPGSGVAAADRFSGRVARIAMTTAAAARRRAAREAGNALAAVRGARRQRRTIAAEREALRLNALGAQLRKNGAAEAAVEQHRAALCIVRELGDRRGEALTLNNVALALARNYDRAAVEHFKQAATILSELGDTEHEAQVIANLGITHRRHGRAQEAKRLLQTALEKLDPKTSEHRRVEEQLRRAS